MPHRQPGYRQNPIEPESRSRTLVASAITCLLVVLVPAMVAFIGYRSIMIHGPSTAVVIGGDKSLEGAQIIVTESADPHRKWITTLDRATEWQSPILLDPGSYHVTVTHQANLILDENFLVGQFNGVRFDLPSFVVVIGNSALADARVEIDPVGDDPHLSRSKVIKFSADSHFRQPVYLQAGEYRIVAHDTTGADRILTQVDFKVDRQVPTHVDLNRPPSTDQ